MNGVAETAMIRPELPEARIIMLTTLTGEVEVRPALDAGRGHIC